MKKYALINEYIVQEVKDLTDDQYALLSSQYQLIIDVSTFNAPPRSGCKFDGLIFKDENNQPIPTTPKKIITKLAMRNRFTFNEKIALRTAMSTSVAVRSWYDDFEVSLFIDLNRADTIAGVYFMAQMGIITQERANQILNDPVTDIERYKE